MNENRFINNLLERVDRGQLSRRGFILATGGILGLAGAYSLLGNVGLPGTARTAEAATKSQADKVRPEDWERMLNASCKQA